MKKFLYWLPRILAILFIGFISLFALDAFAASEWFLSLIMHLIPSFILIIVTAIAWKHEIAGGWLFFGAGGILLYLSNFESLIVSIPAFVIGGLFWISKYYPLRKV
jgi:hypothetical protein